MLRKFIILVCLTVPIVLGFVLYKTQPIVQESIQNNIVERFVYSPQIPSLETIFEDDHSWVSTLSAERIRVFIATGDVIPSRSVNYQATIRNDYKWAFAKTADVLKKADITFINLETPIIKNCPVTQVGMIFCGSSKHIEGLLFSGIDIASLANNHAANYGVKGVEETAELLASQGIEVAGIKAPVVKNIRGVTFAFLGYNDISSPQPGISNAEKEKIQKEISEAKQNADIVIVTYHWGAEYRTQPDERQKELGRFTIDSGADVVIGNHPHWIQPIELYKGKLITYAHGNFVFDQMWSEETKKGVVGRYTFYDDQLVDVEYLPLYIKDYGQPSFLIGEEKQAILSSMKQESIILSAQIK